MPLSGVDAEIYKAYKYAATKCPATEDPRASLRGLFQSKVADGVLKWAKDGGIQVPPDAPMGMRAACGLDLTRAGMFGARLCQTQACLSTDLGDSLRLAT